MYKAESANLKPVEDDTEVEDNINKKSEAESEPDKRLDVVMKSGNFETEEEAKKFLEQLDGRVGELDDTERSVENFQRDFYRIIKEANLQMSEVETLSPREVAERQKLFEDIVAGIVANYEEIAPALQGVEKEKGFSILDIPKKLGDFVRKHKAATLAFGALSLMARMHVFDVSEAGAAEHHSDSHHFDAGHDGADAIMADIEASIGRMEQAFGNTFHMNLTHEQAKQLAGAYYLHNDHQLQSLMQMTKNILGGMEPNTGEIIHFMIQPNNVEQADITLGLGKDVMKHSKESKWQDMSKASEKNWQENKKVVDQKWTETKQTLETQTALEAKEIEDETGKIISTHVIKIPGGSVTVINGEKGDRVKIDAHVNPLEAKNALVNLTSDKQDADIHLTEEARMKGVDMYKALKAVDIYANSRFLLFQALEQAENSGDHKSAEIIHHQLDLEKQQVEKLYGPVFKK